MPKTENNKIFARNITMALEKAIDEIRNECMAEAIKTFEHKLREKVGTLGLDFAREMNIAFMRDEISITLRDIRK